MRVGRMSEDQEMYGCSSIHKWISGIEEDDCDTGLNMQ